MHLFPQEAQRAAVDLLQRAPVYEFGFWGRCAFPLWCKVPVDEVSLLDQAVEFRLEPVFGEGVPRADSVQRHRPGVAEEALEDAATPPLSPPHWGGCSSFFPPTGGD